jgi:hypothetical protein
MKPLPPSFFKLFDYDPIKDDNEEGPTKKVLDLTQHPSIGLGVFLQGIENFYILGEVYRRKYTEQFERIEETLKLDYFNRLYGYLEYFDETKLEHVLHAQDFDESAVHFAFHEALKFYEEREEYLKCARLHKIFLGITRPIVGELQ